MKPKRRSFVLGGVLVVLVGVALASGGLQIPKVLKMLTDFTAATPSAPTVVQSRADSSASPLAMPLMQPASPQLQTDRELYSEYAPGEAVIITSKGWQPGETVNFTLHEQPQIHADRTWTTVADSSGEIFDNQLIAQAIGDNVNLILTARGQSSGLSIQRILNISVTFDQCANGTGSLPSGTCAWTNGNLTAQNSTYAEGMSTAQRLIARGLTSTTEQSFFIGFSYTQSSKHSYDFFDTWTQANNEAATFVGQGLDFGNGLGVVSAPSCVQYGMADTTACNTLDNFVDVSVPGDLFVSTIAGALSGPQSGIDSCTGATN